MTDLFVFILVGFIAQVIDGALGMAYGVSSTTFLLTIGVSPVAASASVHLAEVFTTFVSGISHLKLGNVNKILLKKLLFPGIIGGISGAYILTSIPGKTIKPYISLYLLIMGIRILFKALKRNINPGKLESKKRISILALTGGFFDAVGGGGWGPIVTTTLMANGHKPRYTIGSVNLAEFFVTFAEVITFLTLIKIMQWKVIIGLIIGGVTAAPLAAFLCRKIPSKALMIIVGIIIISLSCNTILTNILN